MKRILTLLILSVWALTVPTAMAQISLPFPVQTKPEKKAADPAADLPKRDRILAQIAEAERRRDEAMRQRDTLRGDQAIHAAEMQHLLDKLTIVERDKLKRLNELEAAQASPPQNIDTWPVVRDLSGAPPYSALRVDALRDALDNQNEKLQGMTARWQAL